MGSQLQKWSAGTTPTRLDVASSIRSRGHHESHQSQSDVPGGQALGAHLAIDRTVLTYLLDTLVEAGVVERVPDPADRRARKIVATERGRQILADQEERVAAAEADLLAGLKEGDALTLSSLIGQLAKAVHRTNPGTNPCEAMDNL